MPTQATDEVEPASKSLQPFVVALGFVVVGMLIAFLLAAQDGFEPASGWAAVFGFAGGIATCVVAIRLTRGRPPATTRLGLTAVLLIAGLASLARQAPVAFQVGGLMWATGFFACVTAIVFLEYRRGRSVS
jgi:hypothetical protein